MEDAHLAVLNLEHPSTGGAEGKSVDGEGCGAGAADNEGAAAAVRAAVRLFGVFDGHGGERRRCYLGCLLDLWMESKGALLARMTW